jgi:hypothetical protein
LYHTESRYEELVQAIGDGQDEPSESLSEPAGIEGGKPVASGSSSAVKGLGTVRAAPTRR